MLCTQLILGVIALLPSAWAANAFPSKSSKRGLVYVPNALWPEDNEIWDRKSSDLTWYYNYKMYPSEVYENDTSFQFVPQLWGAPASVNDTTFLSNVTGQILDGNNITYAMGFNEPDGSSDTGGSDIEPKEAAEYWIKELEPLRKLGVSLGAPAVTGATSGFTWLKDFLDACDGGCTFDFMCIHWYGSFDGMASHIAEVIAAYPGKDIWVTEFALNNATLTETEDFFKTAISYFDSNKNITRYSYFGAFRSSVSNIGVDAAMLDSAGNLTDIGSWYLGGNGTGNIPNGTLIKPTATSAATSSSTYTMPALVTTLSAADKISLPCYLGVIGLALWATIL